MGQLVVGQKAPDFSLPDGNGNVVSLKDFQGKSVVLFFYPKDNTSGCTKEACGFQSDLKAFARKNAVVLGVSTDSQSSHVKFSQKYGLSFPLISDENKTMVHSYGVWKEKSMYGRKYMGTERTTFIINGSGVITHIFPKVKVDGHIEEVLEALASNKRK